MVNIDYSCFKSHVSVIEREEVFEVPQMKDGEIINEECWPLPSEILMEYMLDSHLFDPSREICFSLDKTSLNNVDSEFVKTPFDNIYLTVNQSINAVNKTFGRENEEEIQIKGILIHKMGGSDTYNIPGDVVLKDDFNSKYYINYIYKQNSGLYTSQMLLGLPGTINSKKEEKTVAYKVKEIATNFLLFLNQTEVTYRTFERSDKNRKRRSRKGKTPLPNDGKIEVTGEIERYLNKLESQDTDITHDHRYWVRGHWRTLRDEDHWGDKAGEQVWVKPHIRGEGPLVDKEYDVKKPEGDSE